MSFLVTLMWLFRNLLIIAIVDKILTAKRAEPQADTSPLEGEIDQLVYQLYGLTEDEVKIVEGNA